ncbi:hypothetical protein HDU86_002904 [Geranomyces michiganensis]|nr:hypothetical protein HDU86_002904 [Geranomyces michiganensis]
MPHSTASTGETPSAPSSFQQQHASHALPSSPPSSSSSFTHSSSPFAPTTPPPATASHVSTFRQSSSLSPSVSSSSAAASAAGGPSPHTPPPVMRFQKNLALQKHQATMEDRRGHTAWMQKYRAVYEQVSREYASAKYWHDPFVLSLRRLNAPAHVSEAAAPSIISADPTQAFHHNRLRASSLHHHPNSPHLDQLSAAGAGGGQVAMTRTRSSGPSTSAAGSGGGGGGGNSSGHALGLGRSPLLDGRRSQQLKPSQPPAPGRASTVRGLTALLRGEMPGTAAVARSQ